MPAFRTSGSTGQAPTTVWMSPLADKLTVFTALSEVTFKIVGGVYSACKLCNQFLPFNSSFGAFTTALDGTTNTAQKIVEDTSNNVHFIGGGFLGAGPGFYRMAAILQAAGRTRIGFAIFEAGNDAGAQVIFDISGVQIGVAPSNYGVSGRFSFLNAQITSLGSGWCLCIFDVNVIAFFVTGSFFGRIFLDAGSGTGAANSTYVGDGASGVYGWKSSVLPRQAWRVSATTFFDDFNDPTFANVDQANTKAPGFTWYVSPQDLFGTAPGSWTTMTPGTLSTSSSILRIPAQNGNGNVAGGFNSTALMTGAMNATNTGFVGRGYVPPFFVETRMAFNYSVSINSGGGDLTFWSCGLEYFINLQKSGGNRLAVPNGIELDITDTVGGTGQSFLPVSAPRFNTNAPNGTQTNFGFGVVLYGIIGQPPWGSGANYGVGSQCVNYLGNFYFNNNSSVPPVGTPPPSAPANWTPYVYGSTSGLPQQPAFPLDLTQQHVEGMLMTQYDRVNGDPGTAIKFFDGVCVGYIGGWVPNIPASSIANPYFHTCDWQQINFFLCPGTTTGNGLDMLADYVRVMQ